MWRSRNFDLNHDLAQIQGFGIMKAGQSVCEAFTAGVKRDFPERGEGNRVNVAITEFRSESRSRTDTRLWHHESRPKRLRSLHGRREARFPRARRRQSR